MRLWSVHPRYLDARGLTALWREGLLAQKVLLGETKAFRHHPQLIRFTGTKNAIGAIASYLRVVAEEAARRGYRFDKAKIARRRFGCRIDVSRGQVGFELEHLLNKLRVRDPPRYERLRCNRNVRLHPLFRRVPGDVEKWERPGQRARRAPIGGAIPTRGR